MSFRIGGQFSSSVRSFNMTPIIDIVFLLIIFFLVVSQFIEAENFPVNVPAACEFAQSDQEPKIQLTTVTVMKTAKDEPSPSEERGEVDFAVDSEKISESGYADIVDRLAELIDVRLKNLPIDDRVVTLRIDRDVCFADAQYALAAVAASSATDIKLAVLKNKPR